MNTKEVTFLYQPHRSASETNEEFKERVVKEFYLQLKKHLKDVDFSGKVDFYVRVNKSYG
jgi:hypothetical protein